MSLTDLRSRPAPPTQPQARPRLQISATQLIASALAAVTATIAASYLGVSGTVIGAAVASVLTVLGNAVYSHSIRRTGDRVRTVVPTGTRWMPTGRSDDVSAAPTAASHVRSPRHGSTLRVMAAGCAGVFVGVLLLVTGVELVAGRPISDLLRDQQGSGTTLFPQLNQARGPVSTPHPTVTVTVIPSVVTVTPTVTATAPAVTQTRTPAPSSTPTPTPTPSVTAPHTGVPTR